MELKTLDEIKNGTAVLMPSGIRAKLFLEDNNIIVEYPELYRDKYTKEQFTKIMEEGIQVLGETPNTYQKSAVMENKEETLIENFAKKGYIRESLIEQWKNEAFDFSKEPDGTLFVVMKNKPYEYVTPEFKNELLNILTRISKQYPDVDVRQQAIEFLNTLGLQEYFDTEAIVNFCNQYIPVLNTHVVESLNEEEIPLQQRWEQEMKQMPCIETAQGVIYFEPSEDGTKIVYGGMSNGGIIPEGEIEYEPDKSLDYHIQGLADEIFDKYGYPEFNESLNEEQGPYFGNDAIGNIALEVEAGNKSGFEPTQFGNWMLITNMDTKWEAITEPAKDFLMEKIAMPIADGHVSYDDLEVYVSENSALDREDVATFEVFSEEELDDIFVNGKELRFLVSYELQFDGQMGESFKEKKKQSKKKKIDDSLNEDQTDAGIYLNFKHYMYANAPESEWLPEDCTIDELISWIFKHAKDAKNQSFWIDNFRLLDKDMDEYGISKRLKNKDDKKDEELNEEAVEFMVKSQDGEEGPFVDRKAAEDYINQQIQQGKKEEDFEIITNNGENDMSKDNVTQTQTVTESYKVYHTQGAEVVSEVECDSWQGVEEYLNQTWGDYRASRVKENSEFGTEEDKDEFFSNFEIEPIQITLELEEPCEGEECDVCPECGEAECICEPEVVDVPTEEGEEPQEEQPEENLEEDFGEEHVGEPENEEPTEEPEEETEEKIENPEEAKEVIDNMEDALDTLEDYIKQLLDAEVEEETEEPLQEDTKVLDNGKEFNVPDEAYEIVRKNLLDVMRGYGWVDIEQLQDYIKEEGLELTDEELIAVAKTCLKYTRVFDASELQDTDLQDIKDAYGTVIVVGDFKRLPKNEDFHDGMLTDVSQLDMPDAIAQSIDVNDDGTVMRLKDIMEQVKALKAEMEKTLADFKTDMKDALATLKQDIQRDVNDVDNKVQDTKTAVDGLAVEEGEFEELEEPMESTEEAPAEEEQPEETEENEEEQVEESVKQQGPVNPIAEAIETIIKEGGKTMLMVKEELRDKYGFDTFSPINVPLKNMVEGYIKANKLDKKLISEAQAIREAAESNPAKKFLRKGRLNKLTENLEDAKKKADELIGQGKDAEEIKDAITLLTDNDEEKQQAAEYAVSKMKEQLLKTSKKSKLRSMLSENK